MSNRYLAHLQILPEDDAYREIVNGFLKHDRLIERKIQVLPPAGGWMKVLEKIKDCQLQRFGERRLLLLIDFDDVDVTNRKQILKSKIPEEIKNRVYFMGIRSEPEKLRSSCNKKFESIGNTLAAECAEDEQRLWKHELLAHNAAELARLTADVRPFLFR
ncbi:MAG: hypothetical protein P9F75_02900 [Candidatus Contendobacter sp.]|nr:hypothetical protein [Candidatus Contendobacter sp.]